jgi:hypothetical protein
MFTVVVKKHFGQTFSPAFLKLKVFRKLDSHTTSDFLAFIAYIPYIAFVACDVCDIAFVACDV